jgi:hypothetical protein
LVNGVLKLKSKSKKKKGGGTNLFFFSGNIFCHECSARKVPLPQLGYGTKPVRVCNGCFDVSYLVTYAIDEDHGLSTQVI